MILNDRKAFTYFGYLHSSFGISMAWFSVHVVCSSLEAVNRIYEIKGRNQTSPLAICVGDVSDIKRFAVTDHLPDGLLDSLLPGPVTVILRRGL